MSVSARHFHRPQPGSRRRPAALSGQRGYGRDHQSAIFNKAIGGSRDYDEAIRELLEQNHEIDPAVQLCEALMVGDVQMAADVLRPVYERTQGRDGYVSLEVPPDLAYSVERTVASAHRSMAAVQRPNVMIKVLNVYWLRSALDALPPRAGR